MRYVIFGHQRHGKDTVCEYLSERFGLTYTASSWYACQVFLFSQLRDKYGYANPQECFDDRGNHRAEWYEAIRDYNAGDRTRMGREILDFHAIYCGIRDREEFEALRDAKLFNLAIWVDASDRKPPEDSSSMNLTRADADIIVDNNGTLDDLHFRLDRLFTLLGYPPRELSPFTEGMKAALAIA